MAKKSESMETFVPGLDMNDPNVMAIYKAVMSQVKADLEAEKQGKVDPDLERHKRLQESEAKRVQEQTKVKLFQDGDKYKDDVYVGYNGKTYLLKRGVEVTVPKAVADVLRDAERQALNAAKHTKGLQQRYEERSKEIG